MDRNASERVIPSFGNSDAFSPLTIAVERVEAEPQSLRDIRAVVIAANVVTLGLEANVRFLSKENPDIQSVRELSLCLLERAKQLEALVNRLDILQCGEG